MSPITPVWRLRSARQRPPLGGQQKGSGGPPGDEDFLFQLRQDPDVVDALFRPPPATRKEHLRWLEAQRADPLVLLFIIQEKAPGAGWQNAGWLRFTRCRDEPGEPVDVSVALTPQARGHHLAGIVLRGVCPQVEGLRRRRGGPFGGAGPLRARIKPWNRASRQTFAGVGFTERPRPAHLQWVEMIYRVDGVDGVDGVGSRDDHHTETPAADPPDRR